MGRITRKSKGSYQHGSLKEALLQAALAAIKKNGEVNFTLRELARVVNVTPMAAYRHFTSKHEILLELAKTGFVKLSEAFETSLQKDPLNLAALGRAYIQFALDNPNYFRVMFHPDVCVSSKHQEPQHEERKAFEILMNCVQQNQMQGRFTTTSTEVLAISAWSTVHGLASLLVNQNLDPAFSNSADNRKILIDGVTELALQGFYKREEQNSEQKSSI